MEQGRSTLLTRTRALGYSGALVVLVTVCLLLAAAVPTWANVYASGLVKASANSLTYVLNENADNGVQIQVWKVGGDMVYSENHAKGESPDYTTKGKHTWTWNGNGAEPGQTYTIKIVASDNGYTAWTMISTNSTQNNFYSPHGVGVNVNPNSQYFGRIYVAEGAGGTTGSGRVTKDGIYILNADTSDAVGQGNNSLTGGVGWLTTSSSSPFHVEIGPDDNVYVSDWADGHSGLWMGDPNFAAAAPVLDNSNQATSGLNATHGSISGFAVEGLGADRMIYTCDEDYVPAGKTTAVWGSVYSYAIGTQAMWTGAPTLFIDDTLGANFINYQNDVAHDTKDGTWWETQCRSGSANAEASLAQYSPDGKTLLWKSVPGLAATSAADPLRYTYCVAYDPVHNVLALGSHNGGKVIIFDPDNKVVKATITVYSTAYNYQTAFDARGNVYVVDNMCERMYIYSPPDGANSYTTNSYFSFDAFGTERNLTINVTPDGSGTTTGAGIVYANQHKTVTALETVGYKFVKWTDGVGNTLSTSENYTFDMPDSDLALTAVFEPSTQRRLSLVGNPTEATGTLTGGGMYEPGSSVAVSATAKNLWEFVKWTSDLEGNNVVSNNASFNYTMPSNPTTLYAQYQVQRFNVNLFSNPSNGGSPTVEGGVRQAYNTSVTVHAAPASDGYCFVNWSSNADGTGIVSRKSDYTFTMPGNDVTLYANYAKAKFVENFEGLVSGTIKGRGSLDMNYVMGDNKVDPGIGNGNPWWGTNAPNASAGVDPSYTGVAAHKGSNAAWGGGVVNGREYANLAYRCNNGSPFSENAVYVDWWFYDRLGATWNPTGSNYCDDALSLVNAPAMPSDTDVPADTSGAWGDEVFSQKISLGMATDWCDTTGTAYTGFDPTKYQARIKVGNVDGQTPYASGWYNLNVARTVGWHHARIVVGDIDWGNYVNPVSFYVDDMSTPVLSGTMDPELRGIEFTTANKPTGVTGTPKAAMYDDITFGTPDTAPTAPTAGAATAITTNSITWNWTESGTVDGFRVYDAATAGAQKGADLSNPTFVETGLAPNTLYSRWAVSFTSVVFESARTALDPAYTLAAAPTAGTNVTAPAAGFYSTATWAGLTNPQGFGTGNKVSSFSYKWSANANDAIAEGEGTSWNTGTLSDKPAAEGTYYLYLRSYNGAGVGNGSTKLGAYTFDNTAPTGSVKINNDDATTTSLNVTLTLSATDALSGVDKMSFSNDNSAWTAAEAYNTTKAYTLPAGGGVKTVYVKFIDKAGNSVVASDTITFDDGIAVDKISDLWAKANDSQSYKLSSKAVTGVVDGAFWIEESNRTAAIKVVWSGTAPAQDHAVDVTGTLSVAGGQRILTASSVTDKGALAPADVIKPVVVVERAAGGKGINADTPSISNGSGLYNIGMLVRIAGNLTQSGSAFYLDDGSGLTDGTGTGIKVICGTVTPTAGTKTVTGLVGIENGNPVLIIRGAGDIQ